MKFLLSIVMAIFLISACTSTKNLPTNNDIMELKALMTGSFNSNLQASEDSSYFDITLHMVPVWENRPGHWLYVEQSVTAMQNKPYRQRLYKIEKMADGRFASHVYALKEPDVFVGKWQDVAFFNDYKEDILEERTGCTVFLDKKGTNHYHGQTKDADCSSSLRGATYATSIVTIKNNLIESWDQGFDAAGVQVWGATAGGYRFIRQ